MSAEPGDHDDRDEDHHQGEHLLAVGDVDVVQGERQQDERHSDDPGHDARLHPPLARPADGARDQPADPGPGVADLVEVAIDEEGGEEDQHRQVRFQCRDRLGHPVRPMGVEDRRDRRVELREQALEDAEQEHAGRHGHRDADEAGHDGNREGLDHQQCQPNGVQPVRGEEHAGETGETGAHRPGEGGHPVGVDGGQLGELAAVDNGPDLGAQMRVVEQQVQQHADDRDHDHHGQSVGPDDEVVGEVDGLVADQLRAMALGARPDLQGQADEQQEHAEGRHELF